MRKMTQIKMDTDTNDNSDMSHSEELEDENISEVDNDDDEEGRVIDSDEEVSQRVMKSYLYRAIK